MSVRVHVLLREPLSRAGGIHTYVTMLARGQAELGLEPVLVSDIRPDGHFSSSRPLDLNALPSDAIVHFHFAHGARPVLRAHPDLDLTRSIFHFHGPWFREGRVQGDSLARMFVKRETERRTYKKFTRFVTASQAFADVLAADFRISHERITPLLPAIDLERFQPGNMEAARRRLELPLGVPLISCVRRIEPRMGIHVAIDAIAGLSDVHLAIVGTGSLAEEIERAVQARGLGDRVHLLGRVPDGLLADVYRASDVSVVPTLALEGFGMVVMEAMACGVPVVASDVGGLAEALGPFAAHNLVPAGNVVELAARVARLLTERPGPHAFRQFAETRSPRSMALELERIFVAAP